MPSLRPAKSIKARIDELYPVVSQDGVDLTDEKSIPQLTSYLNYLNSVGAPSFATDVISAQLASL